MPPATPSSVSTQEARILLSHAKEGMVLTRTVETVTRTRLCPAGTVLSPALIQRLEGRGIKRIWIQGVPDRSQAAQVWASTSAKLHERFSRVRKQPYLAEIERLCENALAKRR